MSKQLTDNRWTWLVVGVVAGLCLSSFWPYQPALAVTTDRDSKFAMATVEISPIKGIGEVEGIFVLDFLTGQLSGGVINKNNAQFTAQYTRNVAADFGIDRKADPHYAIVSGLANLLGGRGVKPASGVLYIGELSSGKVICYTFPYTITDRVIVGNLKPISSFQFREPSRW